MLLTRSEIWSIVDGSKVTPAETDVNALAAWKLKDSKARSDIFSIVEKNS